ncbi:MAG TPA: phospho-sugar mutase [Candidatus Krumholzibacteria bacterium]
MSPLTLVERARLWARSDPEAAHRAALSTLIEAGEEERLRELFDPPLRFGTAGLRGKMGPGPGRMNRALVRRVSVSLARNFRPSDGIGRVVVGGDARHGSAEFVDDVCRAFATEGWTVERFDGPVPTPLVAYGVLRLAAHLGVVITASHNPPEYNGYKVYGGDGVQILPDVADSVAAVFDALDETPALATGGGTIQSAGPAIRDHYLEAIQAGLHAPELPRDLRVVYTALHGVGGDLMMRALAPYAELRVSPVEAQFEPDPDFPTVRFPNPEEKGALDLALAQAEREGAELILANDPDADRLAVAVRDGDGKMRPLNGNELGVLLADYLLECAATEPRRNLVMTTVVSSRLLSKLAEARHAVYDECLTGFKWIAHAAREREQRDGLRFLFGYEEALGYTVGTTVRDKDGIGTALHLLELASREKAHGRTLLDRLDDIHRRHGWHRSRLLTLELPGSEGAARIEAIMQRLRQHPPESLAGRKLSDCIDYAPGHAGLPPSNLLAFTLAQNGRLLARPSGTEPKIKFYLELWSHEEPPAQLDEQLLRVADALREEVA